LGNIFPNFHADTSAGPIDLYNWQGDSWCILFSHPADFTPVCTTELARVANLAVEFKKRNVKLIALSCNDVDSHKGWIEDIKSYGSYSGEWPYPIIADPNRELAIEFGMIDPDEKDATGLPLTCRAVFIIGPDKTLKASILYPSTTGRSFDEVLRVVDSLQLTTKHRVATPADWTPGNDVMVQPSVKPEEVDKLFPKGIRVHPLPSGKGYVRCTPQP